MKIMTWNVNSVKARLETVTSHLKASGPDVACLQEIKTTDEGFPREAFEDLGYNVETHGQKSYNGVALLSKHPLSDVRRGLPGGNGDDQARYIEAVAEAPSPVRVASIYLPNGNPVGTEKFAYKLAWFDRLIAHARDLLGLEETVILAGDYNVIPRAEDARDIEAWKDDALFRPESRAKLRALRALGFTDAIESVKPRGGVYTFWDYQARAWERDHGVRIDHLLMSPQAADRFRAAGVDRDVRDGPKPSDHVPVWIEVG